jgi:Cohesin domain
MKMLKRFQVTLAFLLIALILAAALPALAATVTFRVGTVEAQTGGSVDVPITAVAAPSLGAVHLELLYDPKVITPDTVSRGTLAGSNALVDFNSGNPGRLLIGLVTLDAIKGDGAVATVRFKVVGDAGTSSALTLENSKAWESGTHAEVLVKTEAGKVTVGGGFPFLYLAIAITCLAMLLIFIIFFLFIRRRRAAPQPATIQPAYYAPPPPMDLPRARPSSTTPPPMGLPERQSTAPTPSSDAFKKAEDEYFRLKGRLSAGRMTQEQFEAALKDLMVQDAQGRYWMLGVDSGKWFVHNGQTWVEGQPD